MVRSGEHVGYKYRLIILTLNLSLTVLIGHGCTCSSKVLLDTQSIGISEA